MNKKFGTSLSTTNIAESINSMVGRYLRRVTRWQNSNQVFRWAAVTFLEIEKRLNKIKNYKELGKLREKIKQELKITRKNKIKIYNAA